jgi:trehalose-phosphatase
MKHALTAFAELGERLRESNRVLIASDFDGTLCPITVRPSTVFMAPATLGILGEVEACDRLSVAVISGRALADVSGRVPLDLIFAGNHGIEIAGRGLSFSHPAACRLRPLIAQAQRRLAGLDRHWPGAWIENKEFSLTLHYREVAESRRHSLHVAARRGLNVFAPHLAFRPGLMSLEIRPRGNWEKGSALAYIQEHFGPFDLSVCLGDDTTDESMFRANRDQINIKIGRPVRTAASYYLSDPREVAILLSRIAGLCGRESRSGSRASPPPVNLESSIHCRQ